MMKRQSWCLCVLLVFGLAVLLSGCWTVRSVVAPSENMAFVLINKGGRGRLLRCEAGKGCAVMYDTKRCVDRGGSRLEKSTWCGQSCWSTLPFKTTP